MNRRALWKNILGSSLQAGSKESKTEDPKLSEKWAPKPPSMISLAAVQTDINFKRENDLATHI